MEFVDPVIGYLQGTLAVFMGGHACKALECVAEIRRTVESTLKSDLLYSQTCSLQELLGVIHSAFEYKLVR